MGFLLSNYQLTICILLYSLIFCFSSSSAHLCHNDESTALLQFKQSFSFNCSVSVGCYRTSGSHNTDSWKEGTDCCAWDGVTCDHTTSHVIGLDLNCYCLYGTIHPNNSLFNLVHLQHLDLSYNNFNHSQILPSFGRFTNLTHLDLHYSHLSGPIQSSEEVWQGNNFSNSIFHLQKLQVLWLYGNRELTGKLPSFINGTLRHLRHLRSLALSEIDFTGELPNSIGQLEFLEELYLFDCHFSGTVPRSLTNLTRLISLDLGGNNWINGQFPSSIGHLKNLEQLYLYDCHFSGTIPRSLTNLTQLISLDLGGNKLINGQFPSSIGHLKNLEELGLSDCNFSGTIPRSLTNLTQLTWLDLGGNKLINGQFPSSIGHLKNLEYLFLSDCNFSGTIPRSLTNLTRLISLDLRGNKLINGQFPSSIGHLQNLEELSLTDCNFSGTIPRSLTNLTRLIWLNLSYNNFEGPIPQIFGYASMLRELDISHNGLQGVLPRSLANCTNLEIFNVGHNFIEDAFPFWLENLPQLKIIVLRDNKFHGPIGQPRKRLAFTNLHIIDMSHNDFTGTLPSKYFESMHSMMMDDEDKSSLNYMGSSYGYYSVTIMNKGLDMTFIRITTTLKAIDFSHNKFDGKIPISIGRLKALRVLNFSRNGFTGLIPLSLVNLTKLESLDLSQNKFSGEIPQQLTSLTFLEVFDVSQNNLTGIIPRGQQFETFSNTSYEGNLGLCGFPLSKNCGNVQIAESPTLPSSFSHNFKFKFDGFGWEAVLMGYGCGVLLGLLIGSYIIQRKEEWLVRIFGVKMRQHGKRSKKVWKKIAHTKSIINCL